MHCQIQVCFGAQHEVQVQVEVQAGIEAEVQHWRLRLKFKFMLVSRLRNGGLHVSGMMHPCYWFSSHRFLSTTFLLLYVVLVQLSHWLSLLLLLSLRLFLKHT